MRKLSSQAYLAAFAVLIFSTTATAYAQFTEVSGTYTNSDAGVSITFPDGWSGVAIPAEGTTIVSVVPGGMSGGEVSKAMMLIVAEKTTVEGDPTDPSSYQDDAPDCTTPSPTETTVSGKRGFEMTMECTDDEGKTNKMKMTIAETADSWIAAMYLSPIAEFDADVGDYDAAVDTLQIQGAVDATVPTMPPGGGDTGDDEMESSDMPVMVAGESVNVAVQSASTISAFELDEATKTLSFSADGTGDMTVVSVGSVLEGPYTVMVDGQATTDFEESTDDQGTKTITTTHGEGAHEITITGMQVVPEFPVAMLAVLAGVIAATTFAGRTKLFKGRT